MNKQIKKNLIITLIFLFTTAAVNHASVFEKEKMDGSKLPDTGSLYGNSSGNSIKSSDSVGDSEESFGGGLFRSDHNPGSRPGIGEGIGEEAPIGNGLHVLVILSVLLGIVKIFRNKSNK